MLSRSETTPPHPLTHTHTHTRARARAHTHTHYTDTQTRTRHVHTPPYATHRTNKHKLLVSWQFSGPYGVAKYGSGWRKYIVNLCLEFGADSHCQSESVRHRHYRLHGVGRSQCSTTEQAVGAARRLQPLCTERETWQRRCLFNQCDWRCKGSQRVFVRRKRCVIRINYSDGSWLALSQSQTRTGMECRSPPRGTGMPQCSPSDSNTRQVCRNVVHQIQTRGTGMPQCSPSDSNTRHRYAAM